MKRSLLIIIALATYALHSHAQGDEVGTWLSADVTKKIDKKLSIGIEGEYRLTDHIKTTDRWSIGISADYKLTKGIKVDAGYDLLSSYNPAKVTEKENEDYEIERTETESYWYLRHRLHASVTGAIKAGNWKFSLRERWQYTYRPEKTYTRTKTIDDGTPKIKTKTREGWAQNLLRSRLAVEYQVKAIHLTPYVSCEMYSTDRIEKMRYSAGMEYDINKRNKVKLYYLYQNKADEDEADGHVIGIGYSLSL